METESRIKGIGKDIGGELAQVEKHLRQSKEEAAEQKSFLDRVLGSNGY